MYTKSIFLALFGALIIGCNDGGFEGATHKAKPIQKPSSSEPEAQDANKDTDPKVDDKNPDVVTDKEPEEPAEEKHVPGTIICAKTERLKIDIDSNSYQDAFFNPGSGKHMWESSVIRIPLDEIEGSLLPVSKFGLDDIAMIVKSSVTVDSMLSVNAATQTRTISVPDSSLMLYDGANSAFASGVLDSPGATIYKFSDRTVELEGGRRAVTLKHVYDNLGMPLVAHNAVEIADLIAKGYKVGNNIEFKIAHVSHGGGRVIFNIDIPVCP